MAADEEDGNRLEDLGLDLVEYRLTEQQRLFKRAGVFCVWRGNSPVQKNPADSHVSVQEIKSQNILDNYSFPPHIYTLFHGKQFPVRTLWTYSGLAEDLSLSDPPPRLVLFRKIQDSVCAHLHAKEQDICSWPLDLEQEAFTQGIECFRPSAIICFAQKERDSAISVLQSVMAELSLRAEIFLLPDIAGMAAGNQAAKNTAWKILQDIF